MSLDIGPSAEYVYITEDNLNGKTREALIRTKEEAEADNANMALLNTLGEIINQSVSTPDMLKNFRADGRFLFGLSELNFGSSTVQIEWPFDTVLYAEAEGRQHNGAFSLVRVATWMRRYHDQVQIYNGQTLAESLIALALEDQSTKEPGEFVWGIPVVRTTVIKQFDSDESYVYGHKHDLQAIKNLDIPLALKDIFVSTAVTWHQQELANTLE